MILYVATTNPGKLRDFAHATSPGFEIRPLPGIAGMPAPDETADTFAGNAIIKALAYSAIAPGEIVLADDSGIEVDALGGGPGVRSARYADDLQFASGSMLSADVRNNECLLHQMLQHPFERTARYRCVLVAARDGEAITTGEGIVEGMLLHEPRGSGGFGYDPLFLLSELGLTMAEVDVETRLAMSHRGRALRVLLAKL